MAVETTRLYLFEHFKEIDNEKTKASYLLAFQSLIFAELLTWMSMAHICIKIGFIIFMVLGFVTCLFNLFWPVPASLYTNFSGVFKNNFDATRYFELEFESLTRQIPEAMRVSSRARIFNGISFVFVICGLIFSMIYFFSPKYDFF